jgi:hypothetical protein
VLCWVCEGGENPDVKCKLEIADLGRTLRAPKRDDSARDQSRRHFSSFPSALLLTRPPAAHSTARCPLDHAAHVSRVFSAALTRVSLSLTVEQGCGVALSLAFSLDALFR